MKTIFKYPLVIADEQAITIPTGAEILSVQSQRNELCIWALVDTERVPEYGIVRIYGTGYEVKQTGSYLGTVLTHNDSLVWHVFLEI